MNELLFKPHAVPPHVMAFVRAELKEGEQLLCVGQPRPDRLARFGRSAVFMGLLCLGFAIWIVSTFGFELLAQNGNKGFANMDPIMACALLLAMPVVFLGVSLMAKPFQLRRQARHVCYALTNRRAFVWQVGRFGVLDVQSFRRGAIDFIRREESSDGCGNLLFCATARGRRSSGSRLQRVLGMGFIGIEDVSAVESLAVATLLEPTVSPPTPDAIH